MAWDRSKERGSRRLWKERIADLERRDLDQVGKVSLCGLPAAPLGFIRIAGISRPWTTENSKAAFPASLQGEDPRYPMEDALAGLHGQGKVLAFLVLGDAHGLAFHLGLTRDNGPAEESLGASLRTLYHDTRMEASDPNALQRQLARLTAFCGVLTGVPTLKVVRGPEEVVQVERLCRGLLGMEWGYLVTARPIEEGTVAAEFDRLLAEVQLVQEQEDPEKHRSVKHYLELQEENLQHLALGKVLGHWQVGACFFAPDGATFSRLRALLKAVFSGERSRPAPIRTCPLERLAPLVQGFQQVGNLKPFAEGEVFRYQFLTPLNSRLLAALVHLPQGELPGFGVRRLAEFSLDCPRATPRSVALGNVLDQGTDTNNLYKMPEDDLTMHGFIAGVTGSGKTNTCFYLLEQLWQRRTPFLIIEPAKSEYRHLLTLSPTFRGEGQVFTLGDETLSPFRLNPFEVQPGVKVQSHLDHLKAVFNASFEMYAPMPQVLERCLHEIYEDKGWDLVTNRNRRLLSTQSPGDLDCPPGIFPTLKNLYDKIDPVVRELGYSDRLEADIRAALRARIGSLRIGSKGQMLDTPASIPMGFLLERPTVLELKMISDDAEKAFLIGLILIRLYQYRETTGTSSGLQHLTVVEEAHRLLKNVPANGSNPEAANPAGKAVETFTNILAEIRAYGEGLLILDQIPTKLAPEVIKNTNLKVMHRIVAQDDRDTLGGSMNLDEHQKRYATALDRGRALVYAEGMDQPYLVQVAFDKGQAVPPPASVAESDRLTLATMKGRSPVVEMDRFPGCRDCPARCDPAVRDLGTLLADSEELRRAWAQYLLAALIDEKAPPAQYPRLVAEIERVAGRRVAARTLAPVAWCGLTQTLDGFFHAKGARYHWFYNAVNHQQRQWLEILRPIVLDDSRPDVAILKKWQGEYKALCHRSQGPLGTCSGCRSKCWHRDELRLQLRARDPGFTREFDMIMRSSPDDRLLWDELAAFGLRSVERILAGAGVSQPALEDMTLCLVGQIGSALGYSELNQERVVENVRRALGNRKGV